jgi:hypothetical protein
VVLSDRHPKFNPALDDVALPVALLALAVTTLYLFHFPNRSSGFRRVTVTGWHVQRRSTMRSSLFFALSASAALSPLDLSALPPHPRLVVNDTALTALKSSIASSPGAAAIWTAVVAHAEALVAAPPTLYSNCTAVGLCRLPQYGGAYVNAGGASDIITTLAFAWRVRGDAAFLSRARAELAHIASWPSWCVDHAKLRGPLSTLTPRTRDPKNPRDPKRYWPIGQALERASIAYGFALGYDWLYSALSLEERAAAEAALRTLAIDTRLRDAREAHWWVRGEAAANWQINSNAPLIAAALAIADVPAHAAAAADAAAEILSALGEGGAAGLWRDDGIWPEGLSYGSYALDSLAQGCAALASAGVSGPAADAACDWQRKLPGACAASRATLQMTGPSTETYNWGDASAGPPPSPPLRFSAIACGEPIFAAAADAFGISSSSVFDLIWWSDAAPAVLDGAFPLAAVFADASDGLWAKKKHQGAFRSAWAWPGRGGNATAATALMFKGGENAYEVSACNNHGHLDVGSFVLEALGVRWAVDIGHDAYDYPRLNNFGRFRWGYANEQSISHSTLRFDSDMQSHTGSGTIIASDTKSSSPWATVEMTSAYGGAVNVTRTFSLVGSGACAAARTVDAWIAPRGTVNATWTLMTTATIELGGGGALLSVGAARLRLDASAGAAPITWLATRFNPPAPQDAGTVNGLPLYVVSATTAAGGAGGAGITVTMTPGPC